MQFTLRKWTGKHVIKVKQCIWSQCNRLRVFFILSTFIDEKDGTHHQGNCKTT